MGVKFKHHSLWLTFMLFLFLSMKTPLAFSAETAAFEEVFSEFETKWEIAEDISSEPPSEYGNPQETDIRVLVGSDYFGIYVPHKLYKHFNSNGELMCTIQPKGEYSWASLSPLGNRIMLAEYHPKSRHGSFRINVYNEKGSFLFSTPYKSFEIISSDSGSYYLSKPNMEIGFPLTIFNDKGEIIESNFYTVTGWDAQPLDEKSLVYADGDGVMIIKVATNTVVTKRAISDFATEYWSSFNSVISPGGKTIALWSRIEIILIDDNLNLLGKVVMEGAEKPVSRSQKYGGPPLGRFSNIRIEDVVFSQDGDYLLNVSHPSRAKSIMNIVSLSGQPLSDFTIEYFPKDIECGKDYVSAWSRDSRKNEEGFVKFRFFSYILRIVKDSKELISRHIMKNRVHPFGSDGDFLEFGDGFIRRWYMKGE